MQQASESDDSTVAPSVAGAPTADPTPRRPRHDGPENIGPYRILEKMGEGGMGIVYKAEQREPVRRLVALKVIKLGMDTKEVVARFDVERQALALMSHPNVAKVFEAGMTEQGRPYFAMEFVAGVPLTDYCDQNKLTTRERLELFIPVCNAVQHAHQKGIIHRDLKPGNILVSMFDGKPVPKVIDFGIAKAANQALTQRTLYTQTGALIGTPEYMSPEQAQTSGLDVDTRTDIYSLGVILYELLTGELPFDAQALRSAGMDGMARMIRESEPQKPSTRLSIVQNNRPPSGHAPEDAAKKRRSDPRSLVRELRGDLDWITLKAVEKDRTRRYDTANGLAMDIRRHLENEPILARPPSTLYRFGKTIRKHKVGFIAVIAVLTTLMLGVVGTTVGMLRARAATRAALAATEAARQDRNRAVEAEHNANEERIAAMENEALADHSLGRVLQFKGDFAAAEPLMRRTVAIYQQLRGPEHDDVAAALGELGWLLQSKGDQKGAEKTFRDSLEMYKRLFGEDDPHVARADERLGAMLMAGNQPEAAEPLLRRSIDIYRASKSADFQGMASALGDMGMLLQRKGNSDAAEPLLRESLETWQKVPAYESFVAYDIAAIADALWHIHDRRGDKAGAKQFIRQYLLIQLAHIGMGLAASPNDTSFLRSHGTIAGEVGKFDVMAADLDKVIRLTPDAHLLYMQSACAHLFIGDEAGYRDLCRRMLRQFSRESDARVHDRIAKTCLAGPDSMNDLTPVVEMAQTNIKPEVLKNVPAPGEVTMLFRLCAGMAEYRVGNYQGALDDLDDATVSRLSIEPRATAVLFRAMAKYRMHHADEARPELDRAHEMFTKISSPNAPVIEADATIQDWLICQAVRREADGLISDK
jgi:serine/threonine protein kinase/tetratricopeptide (TPR) repeat protein